MERKKISIIIPAYNIEGYLGKCLDSVLKQTYQNLEVIVVDDGSTDKTTEILDKYAEKDTRIVAVHQKNQGVSAARNHGLDLATGELIGFVDGDDIIEPDMYEILVKILEEKKVDIAHCGYQMVFPNRVDYYYGTGEEFYLDKNSGVYELLKGTKIEPGLCNKLYKAELFKNIRLPVGVKINEDLLCNFWLFMEAKDSFFVDLPKYHYMIRKGSATTTPSEKKYRDCFEVAEIIYESCKNTPELRNIAYEKYLRRIMEGIWQNQWPVLQHTFRLKLKKEFKKVLKDRELTKKFKLMVFGQLYLPRLYTIFRKIHDYKNGNNHKYDI